MAIYGYARVSTALQDLDNQKFEILKYADLKKFQISEWCSETISGTKSYKHRELGTLIEKMKEGDVLIISEISRLGRSLMEVMECLNHLMKKNCKVISLKEGFELGDNIPAKIMAFCFGLSAEIERSMIAARTKEALARLKAEGKVLGRPVGSYGKSKLDEKKDMILELLEKKVSRASICKIVECSDGTLGSWLMTRKIKVQKK